MTATLALQAALVAAFRASAEVLALVPVAHIVDRNLMPPPSPSVIVGEATVAPDSGNVGRDRVEVFADVHIWVAEPSTEGGRRIMAKLRRCLRLGTRPALSDGLHMADWQVWRERVLRDPGGDISHCVMTVRAVIGGLE